MHILVVDDEAMLVEAIRIGLTMKGHHILPAHGGREALDMVVQGNQRIDLVLADYLMPGMNGLELLMALQAHAPHLPVMIMTAYAENPSILQQLHNNSMGLIKKPFSLKQLSEEIDRVWARAYSRASTDPRLNCDHPAQHDE